jgi:hypothetical protein
VLWATISDALATAARRRKMHVSRPDGWTRAECG